MSLFDDLARGVPEEIETAAELEKVIGSFVRERTSALPPSEQRRMSQEALNIGKEAAKGTGRRVFMGSYSLSDPAACAEAEAIISMEGVEAASDLQWSPTGELHCVLVASVTESAYHALRSGSHPEPDVPPAPVAGLAERVRGWMLRALGLARLQ